MTPLMEDSRADYAAETYAALKRADLEDLEVGRQVGNSEVGAFGLQRRWRLLGVSEVSIRGALDC